MGTKTISLADDAYERLKAEKKEDESFSDVVRRITDGAELGDFYGVLSEETAEELEDAVAERRSERIDGLDVVSY
ncbi:antitoxin VapB family protein [Halorussus halobius]|uniref:antitoxin VapB family protein n=1 Tax=Halorussus halobius TaxID=1710537 RepID=UPI0010921062|nr:antitoxin VapB family protein [Halorussus halobius]